MDPDSLNPDMDPDPAFQVNPDTDPDPTRIQGFDDQKLKEKNTADFFFFFLFKTCNLLIPRPPYRTSKLQEKPFNFGPPDPDTDPGTPLNPDPQH